MNDAPAFVPWPTIEPSVMPKRIMLRRLVGVSALMALVLVALVLTRSSARFQDGQRSASQDFQEQLTRDIGGADLNQNGIRDDVEEWIDKRFDDSARDRKAFLQLAVDYQRVLVTTGNAQASRSNVLRLSESLRCVRYVLGSGADEEIAQFKAIVLNSDLRVRAWLKAYERLTVSGVAADSSPSASSCRFAT
jgi:hypothetical protein